MKEEARDRFDGYGFHWALAARAFLAHSAISSALDHLHRHLV